ncbi:uncharacterized protein MKK02DRAFT_31385 [Dioszegia hungarica]|uniref:CHCH domain-containing protein n=1 Tax=Dioszegia hungarica TaxID=4972 RepID=A0AA38HF73_9TREE|nr:uncharacterized protein MKK02DRAFT_31385 [Dioszegia hungarica]KAI9637826.1 hypothetical protein MKK02DRAFT_31385 [Dioszegia hungarica]
MPRSGGRSRPAMRPSAPAPSSQQTRSSSTAAAPPAAAAYPQAGAGAGMGRPPGLLAQAASTMGGAVAGSVIGHGISSMIFGSGRPVDQSRADVPPPAEYAQAARAESGGCDIPAKDFTKCMASTNDDFQSCSYYLEALKACQAAAKPY